MCVSHLYLFIRMWCTDMPTISHWRVAYIISIRQKILTNPTPPPLTVCLVVKWEAIYSTAVLQLHLSVAVGTRHVPWGIDAECDFIGRYNTGAV